MSEAQPIPPEIFQVLLSHLPEGAPNQDLVEKLLAQVIQLGNLERGELKIIASALKDFSTAFEVFAPHRHRQKISIFGSARCPEDSAIYAHCKAFAAAAVKRDYMIITGAGPGIMQAGNEGATRKNSFGVGIQLPFEARANPAIEGDPKLINFKYFFTRKLSFVKESAAIVLFPGGFGTLDEGYESLTLLQTGKADPLPVILMDLPGGDYWPSWERYQRENLLARGLISSADRNLYRYTTDVERALDEIELFYRCYHSIRYVGKNYTILRLKRAPTPELLEAINERYTDLLEKGSRFELLDSFHSAERKETDAIKALPRIGFRFVRRGLGRLRRMIDTINLYDQETYPAGPPRIEFAQRTLALEGGNDK